MKIAIGIPTYQRADGSTPKFLTRALESIKKQKHQDFKVFLIGDRYTDNKEFEQIAKSVLDPEKIYFENRTVAPERDKYKSGSRELWCSGGVSAYNHAIDCAIGQGYEYMCHLDHDDYWGVNHLEFINSVIEQDANSALVYTCSTYINGMVLPRGAPIDGAVHKHIPIPANTIHSSVCINHRLIPLKYRDVFATEGVVLEADMDMWQRIQKYLDSNPNLKSYLIRALTCFHEVENH